MKDLKAGILLSARMGSSRLPGKSLMPLKDVPLIAYCLRRLKTNKSNIPVYLVTTDKEQDDVLEELSKEEGIPCFRGSENNLVERYYEAAKAFNLDYLIRATGDCPFINDEIVDLCCAQINSPAPQTIYSTKGIFPVGLDLEFFSFKDLEEIHLKKDLNQDDKEHLTLYFYHNQPYQVEKLIYNGPDFDKKIEFTVDEKSDYDFAKSLAARFDSINFPVSELIKKSQEVLNG